MHNIWMQCIPNNNLDIKLINEVIYYLHFVENTSDNTCIQSRPCSSSPIVAWHIYRDTCTFEEDICETIETYR